MKRLKERAEEADRSLQNLEKKSHLLPVRYPQQDFFIADIFDSPSMKDDIASMEHPLFALKAGDCRPRKYEHNGVMIEIRPAVQIGMATIHDKDIWIYCISKMMAALNKGELINRTVRFTAYDFLVTTNRRTDGDSYERMKDSLDRLRGTTVTTNIETATRREARGFGLIDSWHIIEEEEKTQRMIAIEVTLPDWLYRSVKDKAVLSISPNYFRLRKPLDRRIYELARKHCGKQRSWSISIELLHKKTGSTAPIRNFKIAIKSLVESNDLPDYKLEYDIEKNIVIFKNISSFIPKKLK
ncbi:MAG: replication initiator protein A [Parabacteroides sp.]|nr:replication initiator protein A [Parabacteroides sp.]